MSGVLGEALLEHDGAVLRVRSPMLIASASALLAAGRTVLRSPQASGVAMVDLSAVQEVDSSALSVLLAWLRTASESGLRLRVAHPPASLISLAALYGVAELLPLA